MKPRVLLFGTYESDYSRNRVLVNALALRGVRMSVAHFPLTERTRNKSGAELSRLGAFRWAIRALGALLRLIPRFLAAKDYQAILVLYPGHWDTPWAWLLERIRHPFHPRPILFSPLVSLFDTLTADRGEWTSDSFRAKVALALDRWACRASRRVVLDTQPHAEFFCDRLGIPQKKLCVLPVGAEEGLFYPRPTPPQPGAPLRALFYGKVSPLHGDEVIADAVAALAGDGRFHFTLVGTGQRSAEMKRRLAAQPNVTWRDWIPYERLGEALGDCDVALGVFGAGDKSRRVIPNKVFQAAACAKPIITGETPALRAFFPEGSLVEIERGSPEALVQALLLLEAERDRWERLGQAAYAAFQRNASTALIGEQLEKIINEII